MGSPNKAGPAFKKPIVRMTGSERVRSRVLASVRRDLRLPEASSRADEREFTWKPGRLLQRISASLPFVNDGVEQVRVVSRIPILRDVTADVPTVEDYLTRLNGLAHRSSYVFDPSRRGIDAVLSVLVCEPEMHLSFRMLMASIRLQFLHTISLRERLQTAIGGRVADDEWPVKRPMIRPREASEALRPATVLQDSGANPFADLSELQAIADMANTLNAYCGGAVRDGVLIECPFGRTTALLGLRTNEPHALVGQGLLVFIKLPIFGTAPEIARIATWLSSKEAAGALPTDNNGAWTIRQSGDTNFVGRLEFLPRSMHEPGIILHTAKA